MSLINDMLRDLEKRRRHEPQGKTFTEVPVAVDEQGRAKSKWWLYGSGCVVVTLSVVLFVWYFTSSVDNVETTKVALQNIEPQSEAAIQNQQNEKVSSELRSGGEAEIEALVDAKPSETALQAENITRLLDVRVEEMAENTRLLLTFSALPMYRIVQQDDSAFQDKLVIRLADAKPGEDFQIPRLQDNMILQNMQLKQQRDRLDLLIGLASDGVVQGVELVGNSYDGYGLQIDIFHEKEQRAVVAQETKIPENEAQTIKGELPPPKITARSTKKTPPPDNTSEQILLSKSKKKISFEQQAYQRGIELIGEGNYAAAEQAFLEVLKINPARVNARLQLITALQYQNKTGQALKHMQQGLMAAPGSLQLRKVYAMTLLEQNRNVEALEVLRVTPLPGVAEDPEYHALFAATLQESGEFETAAQVYAALLQLRPDTAVWWFGLAISMDQTGEYEQARNAYRRALALPGLSRSVQEYIQQRLQIL